MLHTRLGRIIGLSVLICLAQAPLASADPVNYVLVTSEADISTSGSDNSVTYTILNLTDRSPTVFLSSPGDKACKPTPMGGLAAQQQSKVEFQLAGCSLPADKSLALVLTVNDQGSPVEFNVNAKSNAATPDWKTLYAIPIAILAALVLVLVGLQTFNKARTKRGEQKVAFRLPLPYLAATWSFKDSWATNVTLVTAVFTGIFGSSDLLKSITGATQTSEASRATVASALAVGIVGVAPLLLQVFRTREGKPLVGGLLLSATLAVGAAGGLVYVLGDVGRTIVASKITDNIIWVVEVAALTILAAYAVTAVIQNLTLGLLKPSAGGAEQKEAAVRVIIETIKNNGAGGAAMNEDQLIDSVYRSIDMQYPTVGNSPGDAPAGLV